MKWKELRENGKISKCTAGKWKRERKFQRPVEVPAVFIFTLDYLNSSIFWDSVHQFELMKISLKGGAMCVGFGLNDKCAMIMKKSKNNHDEVWFLAVSCECVRSALFLEISFVNFKRINFWLKNVAQWGKSNLILWERNLRMRKTKNIF